MLRKSTAITAIITVCLSWLLPLMALAQVIYQRAAQPQSCSRPSAGSQISECEIPLEQSEER
jgi:hypothetical protein